MKLTQADLRLIHLEWMHGRADTHCGLDKGWSRLRITSNWDAVTCNRCKEKHRKRDEAARQVADRIRQTEHYWNG